MNKDMLEVFAIVIGSGGLIAGIATLFKMRPEANKITVDAAQGAIIVQTSVIKNLENEIHRLNDLIEEERKICDKRIDEAYKEIEELKQAFQAIDERKKSRRQSDDGRPQK